LFISSSIGENIVSNKIRPSSIVIQVLISMTFTKLGEYTSEEGR